MPLGDSSKLAYGFVSGVFGCAATGNNDEVFLVYSYPSYLFSTNLFSAPIFFSSRLRPFRVELLLDASHSPIFDAVETTVGKVIGGHKCLDFFWGMLVEQDMGPTSVCPDAPLAGPGPQVTPLSTVPTLT